MATRFKEFKVIGRSTPKEAATEMVTGRARYGADILVPGALHGAVLRSSLPHARILRLDTSKAMALPGVRAVITSEDFPPLGQAGEIPMGELPINWADLRKMAIAEGKTLWAGQPVAAVAASDREVAEEALSLIEVEYEDLGAVNTIEEAMSPAASILHPELRTREPGGRTGASPTNVPVHLEISKGDVDQALEECDVVIEREYRTMPVHQGYIEPKACVASVDPNGRVTVWSTTQGAFGLQTQLAGLLSLPWNMIHVIPTEIGGGFGGKFYTHLEPLAALLSRKAGQPVKMVMTRDEVFRSTGGTSGSFMRVKTGATRDGTFKAIKMEVTLDAGCLPGSPLMRALSSGIAPYRISDHELVGYEVVTNKTRVEAYRGPGAPLSCFAVESNVDQMARAIGMDPLEFRLKNVVQDDDALIDGTPLGPIGMKTILERVKAHDAWTSPKPPGSYVGRGMSSGFWAGGMQTSSGHITLHGDGTASLMMGPVDINGTRTSSRQMVAEALGIPWEKVTVTIGDTENVGYTDVSGGSRITYSMAVVIEKAAREIIDQLTYRAAKRLEVDQSEIEHVDDQFRVKGVPEKKVSFEELALQSIRSGEDPIVGRGSASGLPLAPTYATHVADVQVDPETGKVRLLRYTTFQDVGRAVNPAQVEGQMQGGAVQGIGWALSEGVDWSGGVNRNPTFLDYRMPTALDLPMIGAEIIEVPSLVGPYGLRGVGEVPLVPPKGAIANAILDAIGVPPDRAPMTPEVVLGLLKKDREG